MPHTLISTAFSKYVVFWIALNSVLICLSSLNVNLIIIFFQILHCLTKNKTTNILVILLTISVLYNVYTVFNPDFL